MSRFPGLEAKILKTLEEEEEVRPPAGRIGQEYFWQAASMLQAKGLAVADQMAGVVRRPAQVDVLLQRLADALQPLEGEGVSTYPSAWEIDPHGALDGEVWAQELRGLRGEALTLLEVKSASTGRVPVTDLRARCALLVQRWRQAEGERGRCAIDLEEVLEETL